MFCYEYFIGQNHGRLSRSIVFLLLLEIKTDQRLSLCSLQWDYNRELARLGGLEPLPDATEKLYMAVHERRQADLVTYKKDTWKLDAVCGFSGQLATGEEKLGGKGA